MLLDDFINLILVSPVRCSLRAVSMQLVHAGMSEVCITAMQNPTVTSIDAYAIISMNTLHSLISGNR